MTGDRRDLAARAEALVRRLADGSHDDMARDAVIGDLASWQATHVPAYARLASARQVEPRSARDTDRIPALPTDVFRYARVAAHPPEEDLRVFRTSGTTSQPRGVHPFRDLGLYDRAAATAARYALFPDVQHIRLVVLAPHEKDAPDSSLSYMLSRFDEWFGDGRTAWVWKDDALLLDTLKATLEQAEQRQIPVALVGTSFAFVHADRGFGDRRYALPPGSRIMQTGGFKGRSRTIPPDEMRTMLSRRYDIPESFIVTEYGMTELSSQMYETSLRDALFSDVAPPRRLWVPGWVRATVVDPETLRPVEPDRTGILRVDDVANVDSVCCIQTTDLARHVDDGLEVLGRARQATPRGCSLAAEEALGADS